MKYFAQLGEGIKLLGAMENSPLADASVDMILIRYSGVVMTPKRLADFDRVLKPKGVVVIEGSGWTYSNRELWQVFYQRFAHYRLLKLPAEFKTGQHRFGIHKANAEEQGWYVETEAELIECVTTHKGCSGFQEYLDYAVFQKY